MRQRLLSLFKRDQEIQKIAKKIPVDILEEEEEDDQEVSKKSVDKLMQSIFEFENENVEI